MSQKTPEVKPDGHAAYLKRVARAARISQNTVQHSPTCPPPAPPAPPARPGQGAQRRAPAAPAAPGGQVGGRWDVPGGVLGNNTKLQAAFEVREDENPDCIQRFTLDPVRREYVPYVCELSRKITARQSRFAAQSSASRLLHAVPNPRSPDYDADEWANDGLVVPKAKQWRVTGCSRRRIAEGVAVLYSPSLVKAHFGNLMICGSVWTCPVCSAKISEARKREIEVATDLHVAAGGAMYMFTFTFSHQRNENLVDLMIRFGNARTWMRQHRVFKRLRKKLGCIGDIRTLEVTHGDANGWHPHEHGLWLVSDKLTRAQLREAHAELFTLWAAACKRSGLGAPNRKRGVNIIVCESAADYMAKAGREQTWGIASELSKQHIKVGKEGRMGTFDLLRSYESGNSRHGALFIEFAKAFFGKQQIRWSKGLKAIFGIAVKHDQEVAEQELCEDAVDLFSITAYQWRVVLHQPYDVRGQVLLLAELAGRDAALAYIERLCHASELIPF